jgi:metal transporter CNNM
MDYVVGLHGKTRFCNSDLKSVIELHVKEFKGNLDSQQMGYFTGFLDIMNKKVGELMLPIEKTFKLDNKYIINKANLDKIIEAGYSRIPIYEGDSSNLIGILKAKDLVGIDPSISCSLNELDFKLTEPIHVTENTFFLDLFEKFKDGKSRMAFIHKEIKDEKLLPDEVIEEEVKKEEKKEDNNNIAEVEEPLIINTKNDKNKGKNIKKGNVIEETPVIGILTLSDLIESWLQIHFLEEDNFEEEIVKRKRRKTIS